MEIPLSTAPKTKRVLVLGAGVSGLSSGILLLQKGYEVVIWAKDLPPNTTSNKAAALWYPYHCFPKEKAARWAKNTLDYLKDYLIFDKKSGCVTRKITEVFEKKVGVPWWRDAVPNYSKTPKNQLRSTYVDGHTIEGILMDTTLYMNYVLSKFRELGGVIMQKEIRDIHEALNRYDTVVNCTGLGSRELFNDRQVYPSRAQMVKIEPNGFSEAIADNEGSNSLGVIIPRLNDIVLGGTDQENNWNLNVDPEDTKKILEKCANIHPAFKNVKIIEEYVGLRPCRKSVRLESEDFSGKTVIHNYGHGGAGFTLSWGCAQDVVELVTTRFREAQSEVLEAADIRPTVGYPLHMPGMSAHFSANSQSTRIQ